MDIMLQMMKSHSVGQGANVVFGCVLSKKVFN